MKAFGVGSFAFVINDAAIGQKITVGNFIDELTKTLYKLPTVNNIDIFYDESAKDREIEYIEELSKGINHGGVVNPYIEFLNISIDITLLKRVQDDILMKLGGFRAAEYTTENFRIEIKSEYYRNITLVEIVGGDRETDGSLGVIIIREYLKEEFNKLSKYITFDCQGPSPFHANFYLMGKDLDGKMETNIVNQLGYNDVEIYVNTNIYNDENIDIIEFVLKQLSSELDVFYFLGTLRRNLNSEWEIIEDKVNELMDLMIQKKNVINFFNKKELIEDLQQKLWLFKSTYIHDKRMASNIVKKMYSEGNVPYIKFYVERELEDSINDYPIDDTKSLINLYDSKNNKLLEMLVSLLTALIGGVVGSVVTYLVQST
ncbi:TPA: hypothetical protein ACS70H_000272 [Providencia alcalifaciens]